MAEDMGQQTALGTLFAQRVVAREASDEDVVRRCCVEVMIELQLLAREHRLLRTALERIKRGQGKQDAKEIASEALRDAAALPKSDFAGDCAHALKRAGP
jgi:hypothetical protein